MAKPNWNKEFEALKDKYATMSDDELAMGLLKKKTLKRVNKTPKQLVRELYRHDIQANCPICRTHIEYTANFEMKFIVCPNCMTKLKLPK